MSIQKKRIDLNVDVGERPSAPADGSEEKLLSLVSSANIACGGHAGDPTSMRSVVGICVRLGVSVGAHPGYPDKPGFGRVKLDIPPEELERSLEQQIRALVEISNRFGAKVRHVKPHGALYNEAAVNQDLALCVARAVVNVDKSLIIMGLAGSPAVDIWRHEGLSTVGEAFADRRYEPDGSLRHRRHSDALITSPAAAAEQALRIAQDGIVIAVDGGKVRADAQTICIHSDTQNALAIAGEVRNRLALAGIAVGPF